MYLVEALAADHLSAHLAPRPSAEQAEPGLHTEEAQLQQRDNCLLVRVIKCLVFTFALETKTTILIHGIE